VVTHYLALARMTQCLKDRTQQVVSEPSPYVDQLPESAPEVLYPHGLARPSLRQGVVRQAEAVYAKFEEYVLAGTVVWVTSGAATVVVGEESSYALPIEGEMDGIVDVGEEEGGGCAEMAALGVHVAAGPLQNAQHSFHGRDSFAQIVGPESDGSQRDWASRLEFRYPRTWSEAYQLSGWGG